MLCRCIGSVVIFLGLVASTAKADGLFYQLPEDHTWVRYEMQLTAENGGVQETRPAKLTMASVGQVTEGSERCRWIEVKVQIAENEGEQTIIAKLLVPEKNLKRGEAPLDHMVRGWLKRGDKEPVKLEASNLGPVSAFLSGPLQEEKKLDAEPVESKVGKLECDGVTGVVQFKDGNGDGKITFHNRLHAKAPFGVVTSRIEFETKHNGKVIETGSGELKIVDLGKNAETALPGSQ